MPEVTATTIAGMFARFYRRGLAGASGPDDQFVIPVRDRIVSFDGRCQTFRIPGLAGTTGQKLASIWNGGTGLVAVSQITVDVTQTAAKTVIPAIIRAHRITAAPTGGANLPKVAVDTSMTSAAAVACLQGASVDGTGAALTVAIAAATLVTQEPAPRILTVAGYEAFDRTTFLDGDEVILRPNEGLVVNLDYTVATSNPITDMWFCGLRFTEFTRP